MSNIDDLFRDGLGERRPELPTDLWKKIAAQKAPAGEQVDRLFATALGERQAPVPAGMWGRIVAARRRAVGYANYALLLLIFAGGALIWQLQHKNAGAGPQVQNHLEMSQGDDPAAAADERPEDHRAVPARRSGVLGGTAMPVDFRDQGASGKVYQESSAAGKGRRTQGSVSDDEAVTSRIVGLSAVESVPTLPTPGLEIAELTPAPGPIRVPTGSSFRSNRHDRLRGEVLLGIAYANQSFGLQRGEAQGLRDLREVSEFPELSYQFTARLRYRLHGRLHLLTGLTYAQIRNRIEYERSLPTGRKLVRSNNRIRMLELPLLASLELPGRRLRLNLNAGPVLNLTTGIGGSYLDPDSATPLDLADSGHYRRGVGLGWTASLTTTYPLGKQGGTQLLLEPYFKHYPRSFTTAEAPLSERYWVAGLQLGLRRSL